MERSTRYKGEDVERMRAARVERREPLFHIDGPINLKGHVADWKDHRFLDRVDACWTFLMAHGYLDRDTSEALRARIKEDIKRADEDHLFHCCDARTAEEIWGPDWREDYRGT